MNSMIAVVDEAVAKVASLFPAYWGHSLIS